MRTSTTVVYLQPNQEKEKVNKLGEKRADEDAIEDAVERESQCMYVCKKKMDEYIQNMLKCMFESERMDFRMFVCKVCMFIVYMYLYMHLYIFVCM